jgi:cobalt-zinc-cadmium efflux system protein
MASDHSHSHHHHAHTSGDSKNIVIAFWLNTAFAIIEIAGGFFTNSVAILSDALHDLGDSFSLGLAYYFQRKSKQKRDKYFNYGYKRFSLLGAFINSLILIVSSIFILREAVLRITAPQQPDTKGMMLLAIMGIIVNAIAMLRLRKSGDINEKVVSLHFLEDVLGWVAVLVGSLIMMVADVPIIDPILSIAITLFILYNVFKNLKNTFHILLQGYPHNVNEEEIRKKLLSIKGVTDIHELRVWTMDGQYNVMTLHVVTPVQSIKEFEEIKKEVKHCLAHLNLQHVTIEIEPENNECKTDEQ